MKKIILTIFSITSSISFASTNPLQSELDKLYAEKRLSEGEYSTLTYLVNRKNNEADVISAEELKARQLKKINALYESGQISESELSVLLEVYRN